jgi:glutaredoxin
MARRTQRLSPALAALCALAFAGAALAQTAQVYRYTDTDGRVVYSDRAPPPAAKNVQPKRLGANYIETSELPLTAQQAIERFPVTLYTYDCGGVCQSAEALLNRRGVPYTTVNVTDPANAAKLQSVSGEQRVPVLQIGDKVEKGFLDTRWQAALDQAGYPKTPPARRAPTPRAPDAKPAAPAATKETSVATPAKGTDYPK